VSDRDVAVVLKGLENPFFDAMKDGIEAEARARAARVTIRAAADITDASGQAGKLDAMAAEPHACFLVNPIAQTNLVEPLRDVAHARRPIVNIDNPLDPAAAAAAGVRPVTYIGTDNVRAGALGALAVSRALAPGGRVALLGGVRTDTTSEQRLAGFRAEAAKRSLSIVATAYANWDFNAAAKAATVLLRRDPTITAFFAANDVMAIGVVQAIRSSGRGRQLVVVGVDGILDALKAVRTGAMTATVSQYPYVIGQLGVQACLAAAQHKPVPPKVSAPLALVTADNVTEALASFPRPAQTFPSPFAGLVGAAAGVVTGRPPSLSGSCAPRPDRHPPSPPRRTPVQLASARCAGRRSA
jgi:ABC-type sugar transport system substrate-binding protein